MRHLPMIVRAAIPAAAWAAAMAGCSAGRVHLVPFSRSDLAEGEPPLTTLDIREACWWTEADGSLVVVLHHPPGPPSPSAPRNAWAMCIRLDGPPAGRERLYPLGPREVRMVLSSGIDRRRAASFAGCVVLTAAGGDRLRGRFHVNLRQQAFGVLTGWSPEPPKSSLLIAAGDFTALRDEGRGRPWLEYVRDQGFGPEDEGVGSPPASSAAGAGE